MRWLVFFLFVLNGLVFVWFSFQKEQSALLIEDNQEKFDFENNKPITLLSELREDDLQLRDVRAGVAVAAEGDNGDDVNSQACVLVGPFLEGISAKQAKNRLEEGGMSSKIVEVLKDLPVINWVYIAPLQDRKSALALLKELESKNIDSFLIAEGEYENGISLGYFSSAESARAVLDERKKQGYPVSLLEKKREQKTYWLAFDQASSPQLGERELKRLEEGNFVVNKQDKSCSEVALLQIIE